MSDERRGYIFTHPKATLQILQSLLTADVPWAYVASFADARLVPCTPALPLEWHQGRAFGPEKEVRWCRLEGGCFRVNVLTEADGWSPPGDGWEHPPRSFDSVRDRTILLWGEMGKEEQQPPEWIEVRIPRPLHYPLSNVRFPQGKEEDALRRVVIRGYDYAVEGVPVLTRWTRLEQGGCEEV